MESVKREPQCDLLDLLQRVVIITYHAPGDRKFERIFKEKSLAETMFMVRTKLQPPSNSTITLKQRRSHDMFIDLDDEDDFDAFCVHVRTVKSVDVKVDISQSPPVTNGAASSTGAVNASQASEMSLSVTKNKRKASNDQPPINADETAEPELTMKKRKTDRHAYAAIIDALYDTDIYRLPRLRAPVPFPMSIAPIHRRNEKINGSA
ncbi:hypothetical protein BDR05DRAFT_967566 [Suillus weaverae]|nr:hypothetical protein BDR05DRAFT_967566 [Suillus weaverae]